MPKNLEILKHILRYCEDISSMCLRFSITEQKYIDDFSYQYMLSFPLLQIGELAKKLPQEYRRARSVIPWKSICGLRDMLTHEYVKIDHVRNWSVISKSIPELMEFCKEEIPALEGFLLDPVKNPDDDFIDSSSIYAPLNLFNKETWDKGK